LEFKLIDEEITSSLKLYDVTPLDVFHATFSNSSVCDITVIVNNILYFLIFLDLFLGDQMVQLDKSDLEIGGRINGNPSDFLRALEVFVLNAKVGPKGDYAVLFFPLGHCSISPLHESDFLALLDLLGISCLDKNLFAE